VDENCHLDFHSPYGCSKGAADQYMIDYARIYNIQSCVFRQSCIYGTRQFGIEDQGWVAWFTIASILGKPISIFGDGMQVRDALFIEDLVFAYEAAFENRNKISGEAFNIGGGMLNTLSLLQLVSLLEEKLKKKIPVNFANWRPGDQKLFVCDISKFSMTTGWIPRTSTERGVSQLIDWVLENEGLLKSVLK
jgi:CDP-paratose 2-epimerase